MRIRTLNRNNFYKLKNDNSLSSYKERMSFYGYRLISDTRRGRYEYIIFERTDDYTLFTTEVTISGNTVIKEKEIV